MTPRPFNQGDEYEHQIYQICCESHILPAGFKRAGASAFEPDIVFIHKGQQYSLEVKADKGADWGQKMCKWDENTGWQWNVVDNTTKLYDELGMLNKIDPNFVPRKFSLNRDTITLKDKRFDQENFERPNIECPIEALFNYYAERDCYYLQFQNYGFYHLKKDIAKLGTQQFNGTITFRFRAKTIHSEPVYKYGFYGVLKLREKPDLSSFDINERENAEFPEIYP